MREICKLLIAIGVMIQIGQIVCIVGDETYPGLQLNIPEYYLQKQLGVISKFLDDSLTGLQLGSASAEVKGYNVSLYNAQISQFQVDLNSSSIQYQRETTTIEFRAQLAVLNLSSNYSVSTEKEQVVDNAVMSLSDKGFEIFYSFSFGEVNQTLNIQINNFTLEKGFTKFDIGIENKTLRISINKIVNDLINQLWAQYETGLQDWIENQLKILNSYFSISQIELFNRTVIFNLRQFQPPSIDQDNILILAFVGVFENQSLAQESGPKLYWDELNNEKLSVFVGANLVETLVQALIAKNPVTFALRFPNSENQFVNFYTNSFIPLFPQFSYMIDNPTSWILQFNLLKPEDIKVEISDALNDIQFSLRMKINVYIGFLEKLYLQDAQVTLIFGFTTFLKNGQVTLSNNFIDFNNIEAQPQDIIDQKINITAFQNSLPQILVIAQENLNGNLLYSKPINLNNISPYLNFQHTSIKFADRRIQIEF